jgi:DGQHR domain-containing protein
MQTLTHTEVAVMRRPPTHEPFSIPDSIPIVRGPSLRSGTPTVAGFIPAGVLFPDGYVIPWYDTRTKKGYQRQPQASRINQLANDLRRDRTDLPTAVLLNIRDRDARDAVVGSRLNLPSTVSGSEHLSDTKFYVVDGQHRVLALEKLVEEDRDRWAHFFIPFVCLLGADEEEEMNQFYIVNSTAKSVKTDLALTLLRTRADADADVYVQLQERGRAWQVDGQRLVDTLISESPIWRHRIRLPSMEKGETTLTSTSMVASLKPLLASPYFGGLKPEQQIRVLNAYWEAIRELVRPAFDEPASYTIQKGMSVIVMHAILPDVLERVRSRGLPTVESASYHSILSEALPKLEGENAAGEPVNGIEFWSTAPRGAAGSYSSSAGRRVLAAKIRQLLPPVEVQ